MKTVRNTEDIVNAKRYREPSDETLKTQWGRRVEKEGITWKPSEGQRDGIHVCGPASVLHLHPSLL